MADRAMRVTCVIQRAGNMNKSRRLNRPCNYLKVTIEALGAHAAPRAGSQITAFLLNNSERP